MFQVVTDAIVLDKEFTYDAHVRVHLFTKECGKIVGKATSARKITSKLGAHLEPLALSAVQFVQKNHLPQITDALAKRRLPPEAMPVLRMVRMLAPEYEPDQELWALLAGESPSPSRVLAVLGYDPLFASCEWCGKPPSHFSLKTLFFVCAGCVPRCGASYDCAAL